jgi:hypothetical protein
MELAEIHPPFQNDRYEVPMFSALLARQTGRVTKTEFEGILLSFFSPPKQLLL